MPPEDKLGFAVPKLPAHSLVLLNRYMRTDMLEHIHLPLHRMRDENEPGSPLHHLAKSLEQVVDTYNGINLFECFTRNPFHIDPDYELLHGIIIARDMAKLRSALAEITAGIDADLNELIRTLVQEVYLELAELDQRIASYNQRIRELFRNSELSQRIGKIEGIGPITATALIAAIGDRTSFKNGRQFAAWLGLVPKQYSSGGRTRLLGISKRGDRYLRTLLIHGARAALARAGKKEEPAESLAQ